MSGLYASVGFFEDHPLIRVKRRDDNNPHVHVDIGHLSVLVTADTARELRDALTDALNTTPERQ